MQTHKSFNLTGFWSSPVSPPKITSWLDPFPFEVPELQPLGMGHAILAPFSAVIVFISNVSSFIKYKSFENPPAPSWPRSLGSTSPPNITTKSCFPPTYNICVFFANSEQKTKTFSKLFRFFPWAKYLSEYFSKH